MIDQFVTLPMEEYCDLLRKQQFLEALEAAGVNNWEGFYEAVRSIVDDDEIADAED